MKKLYSETARQSKPPNSVILTKKYFKSIPLIILLHNYNYRSKKLIICTKLQLYYQNVGRSLISKISIPTFIAFSETWLYPSITNSELNFSNYTIFRCDRPNSLNGDVFIVIKSTLKFKILNVSNMYLYYLI